MPDINLFFWLTLTLLAVLAAAILAAEKKAEAVAICALQALQTPAGRRPAHHSEATVRADGLRSEPSTRYRSSAHHASPPFVFFPIVEGNPGIEKKSADPVRLQYALPRLAAAPVRQEKEMAVVSDRHHCA